MAKKMRTNPRNRVLTQAEIEKYIERAKAETSRKMSILSITAAAMSVHNVFGFGPVRI